MTTTINQSGREELNQRMDKMEIVGFSSMGQFSPQEQQAHLDEVDRILTGRRLESQKALTVLASIATKGSIETVSY